ncbi:response regulator [Falsiroseomonas sp. HC035]|uniref:response regulator n=1 Tax=Falsiroseomonas sp. HC035 TaxID=3390999 RepID=UPI003D31D1CF
MRVLIVEDEELIRMLVRDLLEEFGFDCRDAGDVDAVTAILDDNSGWQPDLLVTDYNLGPGPDGVAVARACRRRFPGLPVVYATGNPECLVGQPLSSRDCVVAKPFTPHELVAAVREVGLPTRILHVARQQAPELSARASLCL